MAKDLTATEIDHRVERDGNVATVIIDRPHARNSLTIELVHSLRATFGRLNADPDVRAIVLTGAGNSFCAGQALDDARVVNENSVIDLTAAIDEGYNPLVTAIIASDKPVVAAVQGAAAGAGFSLACACDFRIVADNAFFTSAFVKIGLAPDGALSFTLPRIVGYAKALEICMLSERIDAGKADALGLCTRVVAGADVLSEAQSLARTLASGARSVGLTKRLLQGNTLGSALQDALRLELETQRETTATSDFREGIVAFLGKREPRFTGK
ncbi:MAG: enoyl-CoA hydratase/isomerase family protein [Candidatus Eremiobacteraeota bacterium]|nr:enoyl-CoA hydratase/isomerase family protein [Candidatus Eremiobacteraeota bacterium]